MRQVNYTDPSVQHETMELLNKLSLLETYIDSSISAWLNTFNQWRQMRAYLEDKRESGTLFQNNEDYIDLDI